LGTFPGPGQWTCLLALLLHAWLRAAAPQISCESSNPHAYLMRKLQSTCWCPTEVCICTHTSTWFILPNTHLLHERAQTLQPLQADRRRQCDGSFVHCKRPHCQDLSCQMSGSRRPVHVAGKGHPTTMPSRHQVKSSQVRSSQVKSSQVKSSQVRPKEGAGGVELGRGAAMAQSGLR